jgi:hypothetical protein
MWTKNICKNTSPLVIWGQWKNRGLVMALHTVGTFSRICIFCNKVGIWYIASSNKHLFFLSIFHFQNNNKNNNNNNNSNNGNNDVDDNNQLQKLYR